MTPKLTDPLAVELIELMLKSWPKEKDDLGELLSERTGRIHVAGHLVMAEILGVSPVDPSFDWPRYCTSENNLSITQRIDHAPAGTAERGVLETDVLICLAGVAAESIDAAVEIDQRRARLERAAAQRYLESVEDDEKVRHYWLAYLFELARAELVKVWQDVERAERNLTPFGHSAAPPKLSARQRPIIDLSKQILDAVAEPAAREIQVTETHAVDTDRRQRNAGYIDDGMLDSRLDVFHLPPRYVKSLGNAGVATVRDLISLRLLEMEQVRGIGEAGALAIEAVLNAEGYTYMPGDFPERWRRYVPGSEVEAAPAWKTDPSAPIESLGLERTLSRALSRRNNIHSFRDLLARSEFDLLARKPGVSERQLTAIEQAMLPLGYVLVGKPIRRRWQRADSVALSGGSDWFPTPSDPYGPLEMLSLPDPLIELLHRAQLYTIADLLATSEQYFQRLGLDARRVAQVTKAMNLKGYVLIGVPGKRRWVPVKQ